MDMLQEIEQNDSPDLNDLAPLVEELVVLENKRKALEAEAASIKKKCDRIMSSLYSAFLVSNCKNGHKFDNGVNIRPILKETVFRAQGVDEESMLEYLSEIGLGHIIKPTVHWKTLSTVMLGERELGRELDSEMFTVKAEQRVQFVGNGHIKFLEKTL